MAQRSPSGIFCLEGEWDPNLTSRTSVQPLLELLERLGIARIIHRDVATREELAYYLRKWTLQKYAAFKSLNLACHGDSGLLHLGKDVVSLDDLGVMLHGRCRERVIYFGSCLTLARSDSELTAFARQTGARAVVGYCTEVNWLEAASFELLLLDRMIRGARTDHFFNGLLKDHARAATKLGLVVATARAVYDAYE